MRAIAFAAMFLVPLAAGAQPCDSTMEGATQLESPRFSLGYRVQPEKIAVGRHFGVEVAVCPKSGTQMPDSVTVDARMPEHRHGMNYKAQVVRTAAGHFKAEGLMFHMPGRWEFVFDLRSGDRTDRVTQSIVLE